MKRVRRATGGRLNFFCVGCQAVHGVFVESPNQNANWQWNGDEDKVTLSPSVSVTYNGTDADQIDEDGRRTPAAICHSFITDGKIIYLSDCTHTLVGQTVDLPDITNGFPHKY